MSTPINIIVITVACVLFMNTIVAFLEILKYMALVSSVAFVFFPKTRKKFTIYADFIAKMCTYTIPYVYKMINIDFLSRKNISKERMEEAYETSCFSYMLHSSPFQAISNNEQTCTYEKYSTRNKNPITTY